VDKMLCIFDFEEAMYRQAGVRLSTWDTPRGPRPSSSLAGRILRKVPPGAQTTTIVLLPEVGRPKLNSTCPRCSTLQAGWR